MFSAPKKPRDKRAYPQSPDSRPLGIGEQSGRFVYVVDIHDRIYIAPDGPHVHPLVLGLAQEALYAGEIEITQPDTSRRSRT
jgi:hypothetical protein